MDRTTPWTILSPILAILLLSSVPVEAGCAWAFADSLEVPTLKGRPLAAHEGEGLSFRTVADVLAGSSFSLAASGKRSVGTGCNTGGPCTTLSDLDVSFFTAAGTNAGTYQRVGDETGRVPYNAAFAVVWLVSGTAPGETRADFTLLQGC